MVQPFEVEKRGQKEELGARSRSVSNLSLSSCLTTYFLDHRAGDGGVERAVVISPGRTPVFGSEQGVN